MEALRSEPLLPIAMEGQVRLAPTSVKPLLITLLLLGAAGAFADSPLTSTDFAGAYADDAALQAARKVPSEAYAVLAGDASNDCKLALANMLGGGHAEGFLTALARELGKPAEGLTVKDLTPSQRFVTGYLIALDHYLELEPLQPGGRGVWGMKPLALLDSAAAALPDDFAVQLTRSLVRAQKALSGNWCQVFRLPNEVLTRFPPARRNLRPGAVEAAFGYLRAYESSCPGSKAASREQLEALNQLYTLSRLGSQVVAGTQGGAVVWNPAQEQPVATHPGFICKGLQRGDAVWVGCEAEVLRWDGARFQSFLSRKQKGSALYYEPMLGPDGALWVRLGKQTWAFDDATGRFKKVTPPWQSEPYDARFVDGAWCWIDFLNAVQVGTTRFPKSSPAYPGSDPRRFRVDGTGALWVEDFESGLFRFDDGRFVKQPGLDEKGSGVAVDQARDRRWLLHYTRGPLLLEHGKSRQIDLTELQYMRDLLLDETSGDLWVAGWTGLVRLHADGAEWSKQRFRVR